MDVVLSAERASINNVNMELKATILFQPKGVENSYDENETGIISKDELLKKIIINDKIQ